MSVYDMLPRGSQLKCWGSEMKTKHVGDAVYDFGYDEYVILLREGGYVKVEKGVITKIVENYGRKYYHPEDFLGISCFDKWGCLVLAGETMVGTYDGMLGMKDPYYPEGDS